MLFINHSSLIALIFNGKPEPQLYMTPNSVNLSVCALPMFLKWSRRYLSALSRLKVYELDVIQIRIVEVINKNTKLLQVIHFYISVHLKKVLYLDFTAQPTFFSFRFFQLIQCFSISLSTVLVFIVNYNLQVWVSFFWCFTTVLKFFLPFCSFEFEY